MDSTAELVHNCRNLNNQSLFASAASLAAFAAGSSQQDPEVFIVFGNALFGLCEYKRALPQYRRAFDLISGDKDVDGSDLLWKIAECHRLIGDFNAQLSTLETIPIQMRTPAINVALGKLYQRFNIETVAIACFLEALTASPLAVEAIEPLALMNVKEQEILSRIAKHGTQFAWLMPLATARIQAAQADHRAALQTLKPLTQLYPDNRCPTRLLE
jgi:tetratricopeptide (TPR) repeat protein